MKTKTLQQLPFLEIANIAALPLYDSQRYFSEATYPRDLSKYRDQLENSKAILFSVNEHEHGSRLNYLLNFSF